jgi:hypothetical protein
MKLESFGHFAIFQLILSRYTDQKFVLKINYYENSHLYSLNNIFKWYYRRYTQYERCKFTPRASIGSRSVARQIIK